MNNTSNTITSIIRKYRIHLLIFGIAIFLLLGCTLPKIFINDEWITDNQLAQIDQGHQVITSEGKYGAYPNGTPSTYLNARNNGLGYTLFLPFISLPALKCINFFGDAFLFFLVEFWTILLIAIALFVRQFFPEYSCLSRYNWTNVTIIAAFVLFFCNLVFYQPFILAGTNSYPEIAAIVLTNVILLALLAVFLYATYFTIFKSQRFSLSATIISICCSSYIFWTTSAKDHMLMVFLFGVLIFCGIKYIYTNNRWYVPAFFIVIGWIAWTRAEIAVPLFGVFLILIIVKSIITIRNKNDKKTGIFLILSPVFTIIGAIPFFINNYYVTKNPLLPPYAVFNQNNGAGTGTAIVSSINTVIPSGAATPPPAITNGFTQFFDTIISNYFVPANTSIFDLLGALFLPGNRSAVIFIVCPILIIGLALALLSKITWSNFTRPEKRGVYFLVILSVIITIAYIHSWIWMSTETSMAPDIRYFSPIYLPFSIMGILLIQKCGMIPTFSKKGLTILAFSAGEISVILVTFLIVFKPADNSLRFYLTTISETITCITLALMILCILVFVLIRNIQDKRECSSLILYAIIGVPLVWQLAMIFSSSICTTYEGYTYWIPVVKTVMQHLQDFIV